MEQQAGSLKELLIRLHRREQRDQEAPDGIAGEFARLKSQSVKYRSEKTFTTRTADKQENIKKNRYKDIVPFDHTRVKLTFTTSKNDSDYINANFIKGVSGSRAYIATQGPLPHTVVDFLRMLWEYDIGVVVMACREFEMGKKKCELYWPQKQEKPFVCEPFTVDCDSEENKGDYLIRTLRMTYRDCSRTLKQLHYIDWPDHGVPDSIPPILDLLQDMRSFQTHDDVPVCIHCSAGCGRTGALCVIDYTWNLLKKQMITSDFSIFEVVQKMRTQRPSLVQTKEQYQLVYRTISFLFQRHLASMEEEEEVEKKEVEKKEEEKKKEEDRGIINHQVTSAPSSISDLREELEVEGGPGNPLQTLRTDTRDPAQVPGSSPEQVEEEEEASLKAAAVCLMVEDPYFENPPSPPEEKEQEEEWTYSPIFTGPFIFLNDRTLDLPATGAEDPPPPPLPERTPASYHLAVNAAVQPSEPCGRLIIPPNAAAEAVRELEGCPPSPVPSLPERTPESYQLASEEAPVGSEVKPRVHPGVVGLSSEWSGPSNPGTAPHQSHGTPFSRSKSLRAKMTFTAPEPGPHLASGLSSRLHPSRPPLEASTPQQPPHAEDDPTPPLPDRTPESFLLGSEPIPVKPSLPAVKPPSRTGVSSEWDGTSQPKFQDVVMMRSKSVRARSSKQEPLSVTISPLPVVPPAGGSAPVEQPEGDRRSFLKPETSDKYDGKAMTRTRSLKFFKQKQKPTIPPPPPPTQPGPPPPQPNSTSSLLVKLGFGNRFRKPKGPRRYPETWV